MESKTRRRGNERPVPTFESNIVRHLPETIIVSLNKRHNLQW